MQHDIIWYSLFGWYWTNINTGSSPKPALLLLPTLASLISHRNTDMALHAGRTHQKRKWQGGAFPLHLQRHHALQAAHRRRNNQRWDSLLPRPSGWLLFFFLSPAKPGSCYASTVLTTGSQKSPSHTHTHKWLWLNSSCVLLLCTVTHSCPGVVCAGQWTLACEGLSSKKSPRGALEPQRRFT